MTQPMCSTLLVNKGIFKWEMIIESFYVNLQSNFYKYLHEQALTELPSFGRTSTLTRIRTLTLTRTHTGTRTHTHTHAYTCTRSHIYIHTRTHTSTTHTRVPVHARTHTRIHSHAGTHMIPSPCIEDI